jgi:transposase-like protein
MTRKVRKTFPKEVKNQAVDDYISGERSALQIAEEIGCDVQLIYRWKVAREEKAKGLRLDELVEEGCNRAMAEKLLEKELEIEAYQRKVAEQAIMLDLIKKLQTSTPFQRESELAGLIRTSKSLEALRRRAKK